MDPAIAEKLRQANIQLAAETGAHLLFTRDNFIALVEHREGSSGSIGSTGVLTEQGLAYLVWHDGAAFFKSKTAEILASEEQVVAVRRFSEDLAAALR